MDNDSKKQLEAILSGQNHRQNPFGLHNYPAPYPGQAPRPNWQAADPFGHIPPGWRDNGDGRYVYDPLK